MKTWASFYSEEKKCKVVFIWFVTYTSRRRAAKNLQFLEIKIKTLFFIHSCSRAWCKNSITVSIDPTYGLMLCNLLKNFCLFSRDLKIEIFKSFLDMLPVAYRCIRGLNTKRICSTYILAYLSINTSNFKAYLNDPCDVSSFFSDRIRKRRRYM